MADEAAVGTALGEPVVGAGAGVGLALGRRRVDSGVGLVEGRVELAGGGDDKEEGGEDPRGAHEPRLPQAVAGPLGARMVTDDR